MADMVHGSFLTNSIVCCACKIKTVDPKFPGTGLADIKKSFEKIAMTFWPGQKLKVSTTNLIYVRTNSYGT